MEAPPGPLRRNSTRQKSSPSSPRSQRAPHRASAPDCRRGWPGTTPARQAESTRRYEHSAVQQPKRFSLSIVEATVETGVGRSNSLGFKALLHGFSGGDQRRSVLDLGPAQGQNVEFFSQFSCRLSIADLYRSWRSLQEADPSSKLSFGTVCTQVLSFPPGKAFDYILAWDLLSYLEAEQISLLGRKLAPLCRRETRMLALISTRKTMPAVPYDFRIVDGETLDYGLKSRAISSCPQHKEPDLARLLPGFQVESTYLLRNGMQEYVFSFGEPGGR